LDDDGVLLPRPMFPNMDDEPKALGGDVAVAVLPPALPPALPLALPPALPPALPLVVPLPPKMDLFGCGVPNDEPPNKGCAGVADGADEAEAGRDAPMKDGWPKTFVDIGAAEATAAAAAF